MIIENLILEFVLCLINTYRQRNNSTGVRKHIQKGKYISYQAYISINNKQINLGYFDTKEKAIIARKFADGGFVGNLGLSKKLWNKYVEVERKYKTDTDKMTASDYTHLFGYLNPYYRTAYSIPKRKR